MWNKSRTRGVQEDRAKKTQGTKDKNRTDMGETDKPTWNNTGLTTQGAIN